MTSLMDGQNKKALPNVRETNVQLSGQRSLEVVEVRWPLHFFLSAGIEQRSFQLFKFSSLVVWPWNTLPLSILIN